MIKGGARHLYYLKPDQIIEVLKYNFLSQPFGAMASMSGKCSVAFLVLRLIGPNTFWRKWCLYVNVGVYTVITVISIIVTFVQCRPSRALWEPVAGAKCWDPKISADITIFQAGTSHRPLLKTGAQPNRIISIWYIHGFRPGVASHHNHLGSKGLC